VNAALTAHEVSANRERPTAATAAPERGEGHVLGERDAEQRHQRRAGTERHHTQRQQVERREREQHPLLRGIARDGRRGTLVRRSRDAGVGRGVLGRRGVSRDAVGRRRLRCSRRRSLSPPPRRERRPQAVCLRDAHGVESRLGLAAAGRLDSQYGEAEQPVEEVALDVDVLDAPERYLAALSRHDARLHHERLVGEFVGEPEVARRAVREAEQRAHRAEDEHETDVERRELDGHDGDEKAEAPHLHRAPEGVEHRGDGMEAAHVQTASSNSLSTARSRRRSRRSVARDGRRPGMVMSAPRDPAV
jgi:hypothetical protein